MASDADVMVYVVIFLGACPCVYRGRHTAGMDRVSIQVSVCGLQVVPPSPELLTMRLRPRSTVLEKSSQAQI